MPHPTVSGSLKSIRDYVPQTHLDSLPPSLSPRLCGHLSWLVLLIVAMLTGARWQRAVAWICISLIIRDAERLSR